MKAIVLIFSILLTTSSLSAQGRISNPTFSGETLFQFRNFFFNAFNSSANRTTTDTMCISSVTFIKFSISEKGEIVDLTFNEYSNSKLNKIFEKILESSNGKWQPARINGRPVKSKPIIFPLLYDIHDNTCKPYAESAVDFYKSFLEAFYDVERPNSFISSNGLDCILMKPCALSPLY
jgi:hypothetical protein